MLLKKLAFILFVVVFGMSWIVSIKNKEIECYSVSAYIDDVHIYGADDIVDQNLGCNSNHNHDDLKD